MQQEYTVEVDVAKQTIRELRLAHQPRLSQEALARAAGISTSHLVDLERGREANPRLQTMKAIADALGVPWEAIEWFPKREPAVA